MNHFQITQAKIIDAQKIALFLQQNFKYHNLKFDTKYVENLFKDGVWFYSKINDKILGVIFLKIIKQDNRAELKHLSIKENFRGRGIGKALLNEAIKFSKKKKIRKLTGVVSTKNIKAFKKLVKIFNFKLEGVLKQHYRKNENAYIYSLFLKK